MWMRKLNIFIRSRAAISILWNYFFFFSKLARLMSTVLHTYRYFTLIVVSIMYSFSSAKVYSLAIFQSPAKKPNSHKLYFARWTRCSTPFVPREYFSFEWKWRTCDWMNTDASSSLQIGCWTIENELKRLEKYFYFHTSATGSKWKRSCSWF